MALSLDEVGVAFEKRAKFIARIHDLEHRWNSVDDLRWNGIGQLLFESSALVDLFYAVLEPFYSVTTTIHEEVIQNCREILFHTFSHFVLETAEQQRVLLKDIDQFMERYPIPLFQSRNDTLRCRNLPTLTDNHTQRVISASRIWFQNLRPTDFLFMKTALGNLDPHEQQYDAQHIQVPPLEPIQYINPAFLDLNEVPEDEEDEEDDNV